MRERLGFSVPVDGYEALPVTYRRAARGVERWRWMEAVGDPLWWREANCGQPWMRGEYAVRVDTAEVLAGLRDRASLPDDAPAGATEGDGD